MKMKKLMVCMAAIGLVVGVQAATYDWKTSANAQGVNATAVTDNGDYAAGTSNMKGAANSYTVILALYDVGFGGDAGHLVGQTSAVAVKYNSTNNRINLTNQLTIDAATAGTTYDYVLTITGTQGNLTSRGEDTAAGFDYTNARLTTTIDGTIQTAAMGNTTLTSAAPSLWTISGITPLSSSDVPEPTSGLLLVLGGAMLALRRRR